MHITTSHWYFRPDNKFHYRYKRLILHIPKFNNYEYL